MVRRQSFLCAIWVSDYRHPARQSQSEQLFLRFLCKASSENFSTVLLRAGPDLRGSCSEPPAPGVAIGSGPKTLLRVPDKLAGTLEGAMGPEHPRPFLVSGG